MNLPASPPIKQNHQHGNENQKPSARTFLAISNGSAVVYGHGVFSIGMTDFREAFQGLVDVENWCRAEYFRRFDEKYARQPGMR